ncbi:MAG: hypothetical protein PHY93_10070 [Bacteriovorax sp.]|nr:hypothetical protein [Bacteriovorax sp.]
MLTLNHWRNLHEKYFITIALCCSLTSLHAEDRRGDVGRRELPENRELRACQIDRNESSKIYQLSRENRVLIERNQSLIDQVGRLKVDNARLEMEAHPDRVGDSTWPSRLWHVVKSITPHMLNDAFRSLVKKESVLI